MNTRAKITNKKSEAKSNKSASKIQKSDLSQSISLPINHILFLHRTIGNQAVQKLFKSGVIQAKLRIGQPNDKYEQEADRVADEVMRMREPQVQRQVEPEEEEETLQPKPLASQITPLVQVQRQEELEEEEETLQAKPLSDQITPLVQRQVEPEEEEEEEPIQTKQVSTRAPAVTPNLASRIQLLKAGGQPLPKSVRDFFEPRFGHDFSHVRVHTDAQAVDTSQILNAQAFTVGRDIVFGVRHYAPETTSGRKLLAHELTHVLQQEETVPAHQKAGGKDSRGEFAHLAGSQTPLPVLQRTPAPAPATVTIQPVRTVYYNVTGNTLAEVSAKLDPIEWGRCDYRFRYTYRSTNGVATQVSVTLRLTIRLPRWTGRGWGRASAAAKAEWRRMLGCLRTHENGHAGISRRWAPILQQWLLNQSVANLATIWERGLAQHEAEQVAYDSRTRHGQTQNVTLDTRIP